MTTAPLGWITASFTDILDIQGGTQPPKSAFHYCPAPNLVRLLQIRDFGDRPVPTYIPNGRSLKRCDKDDILIGRYGASVGRICTGMEGAYNVALAKVIIPDAIDRRFVFWLLKSPVFQQPILQVERSAQNGFNKNDLSEIPVLLPPLIEQRRVVEKLEEVIGHVNSASDHLSRVPAILKRFRQAVLAAACSGRLTEDWRENTKQEWQTTSALSANQDWPMIASEEILDAIPETWRWCRLGAIGLFINGDRGKNYPNRDEYVPQGIPFINTGHIEPDGSLSSDSMHYLTREKLSLFGAAR